MNDDTPSPLSNVITIDDERIKNHVDRVVRGSVEETLNALLAGTAWSTKRYLNNELLKDQQMRGAITA